ncbi:hypothetical protein ACFY36_40460 [Actinoplanes sp. NPDC000266]
MRGASRWPRRTGRRPNTKTPSRRRGKRQPRPSWRGRWTAGWADPSTLETLSRLEFWASGARRAELRERILRGWRGGRFTADQERLLGADHPDTLRSLIETAGPAPDESLLARAHAVLGADDRDVELLRGQLIVAYTVAGRDDDALALVSRYPVAADGDLLDEAELP